jgi:hypothetical protein
VQASPDQRQWFQQLFFPEGISFDGNGFVRTAVTAPAFSYLRPIEAGNEGLVAQTGIEPNLVAVIDANCQQWSHNSDQPPVGDNDALTPRDAPVFPKRGARRVLAGNWQE